MIWASILLAPAPALAVDIMAATGGNMTFAWSENWSIPKPPRIVFQGRMPLRDSGEKMDSLPFCELDLRGAAPKPTRRFYIPKIETAGTLEVRIALDGTGAKSPVLACHWPTMSAEHRTVDDVRAILGPTLDFEGFKPVAPQPQTATAASKGVLPDESGSGAGSKGESHTTSADPGH
jgi:hypothetical protein